MKQERKQDKNEKRQPVICIMGHIDHGKSTLLDFIRKTNLTEKEAGGITQHIGAYEVALKDEKGEDKKITFLDTPGHEAFSATRQRGANVADIAVIAVSAEDGVMPQTKEAIRCAKESETPFVIAITKTDKPNADIEKTKQSLAENEIYIEGYGGDVPAVPVSGKTGEGVPELLEVISIMAEMEGLSGDKNAPAEGVVIESHISKTKGISATLVVKNGTLKKGDFAVAEDAFCPIRSIEDWKGTRRESAGMGEPAVVVGWNKLPQAGAVFFSAPDKKTAEEKADEAKGHAEKVSAFNPVDVGGKTVVIPVVIKADATGSADAIKHEIGKIKTNNVIFRTISEGIGNISENDIKSASVFPNSVIVGFNVGVDERARALAERDKVSVSVFGIIYELADYLARIAEEKRPREIVEKTTGKIKVLKIFQKDKDRQVLGGKVTEGSVKLGDEFKLMRRDNELCRGKIRELQKQKNKAEEVFSVAECGILAQAEKAVSEGDVLELFVKEEV